ncbi:uncharacterized protein LOC115710535 [Cannabis sativa]|uniref:uncharacterized protein LOC115710535 n=1 Tax=Cannabis sativa TaxID=3483 RepID=UPI0029CA9169|nr:uncharacterized protein LOC115710535 [Cannabis sativa]
MISNNFPNWDHYTSPIVEGRILLLWQRKFVQIEVIDEDDQLLHSKVKIHGLDTGFIFTAIYGKNSISERKLLWDKLAGFGMNLEIRKVGIKPFRFFNHWLDHSRFKEEVLLNWNKPVKGEGLSRIMGKLNRLKHCLKRFNNAEIELFKPPKIQRKEFYVLANKRTRATFKQISKISWLRFGDENSSFFHASVKKRKEQNRITTYVSNACETVYKEGCQRSNVQDKQDQKSSPDGYGAGFFKDLRNEIGEEISVLAILSFFDKGIIPADLNKTTISLVPKVDSPASAIDYRPIACCNTLYKCISKMICSRLSEVLPDLIHSNQGAFVRKRSLAHNVLIFQDLLKGYTRKHISARCLMKVDLSKAYDTVDWEFIMDLLKGLCFPTKFIKWIMVCLCGTSYTLMLNGRLHGTFQGKKGLRQGDPISPLLFVLVMEYLTRLLIHASNSKGFGYHPMCKSLKLTNLCFADDLVIFCKGNASSLNITQHAFTEFCNATGLTANATKSSIYFGGVSDDTKKLLKGIAKMEEGSFPLKYLGVNLRPTKWKASDCGGIINKIQKNLHCWSSRHLSFAGKAQLINSILLGIRSYWMSIFILPQKVTKEIDKLCRNFLWGSSLNQRKLHFSSWEKICLPKNHGGIGVRESQKWNVAMMARYIWALSTKQDSLWIRWVDAVYMKGEEYFWSFTPCQDMSWYFRKLVNLRDKIDKQAVYDAGISGKFRIGKFYNSLISAPQVLYHKDVWHKLKMPKHRFILWQAINGNLQTRDRLVKGQVCSVTLLQICGGGVEIVPCLVHRNSVSLKKLVVHQGH